MNVRFLDISTDVWRPLASFHNVLGELQLRQSDRDSFERMLAKCYGSCFNEKYKFNTL